VDGTGAALRDATAIFRADQTQVVAQDPQKRSPGIDIVSDHPIFAIDADLHGITACFSNRREF
jgi:hypothetical protein